MADKDEVVVDDEGNVIEEQDEKEEGHEDESLAQGSEGGDDHDDADEEHSEEASSGDDDEDRERIRERRREERKFRKEKQRTERETLRRELSARDEIIANMQEQLNALSNRSTGSELAQVEQELQRTASAYNTFKAQHAAAIEAADGTTANDAMERMFAAKRRGEDLQRIREAIVKSRQQPAPLDTRLVTNARSWVERHSWYDPNGGDRDSRRVKEIDDQLAREGWNPATTQYWEELTDRVKKALPNKFPEYNRRQGKPKSVIAGSGRESAPSGGAGYRISADRVAALKQAGMWDDPKKRAAAIKQFREYDRQNQDA